MNNTANKLPVDEEIIFALSNLVDDAKVDSRKPSHADIFFEIKKAGLTEFDPNKPGMISVGKAKRVKNLMSSALENKSEQLERFAYSLFMSVRAVGGFNNTSINYVGLEPIKNLASILKRHSLLLSLDGSISPMVLENLTSQELTTALQNYVLRAKKGIEDAALLVGTGKDLMEAVCAHVITEIYSSYPQQANFPTLLGQTYTALGLSTSMDKPVQGEHARKSVERNIFDLACSINKLRNKQGTGHGRPWIPDVSEEEAVLAIESIGVISEFLLKKLSARQA